MEIGNIVSGHINELLGLNKNLSEERMKVCRICPIFSEKLGGICNSKLWINPETDDVSLREKPGYVQGCACRLQAKTTLVNEHCPANKW